MEPRLDDGPSGAAAIRISADDRLVAGHGGRSARPRTGRASSRARRPKGRFRLLRRLVYWTLVLGIWAGIAGVGLVGWYGARMPAATSWSIPDRPPNVRILSVDGALIANRGLMGGEAIGLHEMSPFIAQAVIAIEDRRFFSHFGLDPIGLARAAVKNLVSGAWVQGGSTLTQQLAKNLFLKPERTLERKVQEVLLAFWLEHEHSKEQILEMYLNRVYFGSGAYGVEAAARRYFGKMASDVNLAEAALLAGLLKAPSRLSPARDPEAANARAQLVLQAMRDQGMIGDGELAAAISAPATRAAAYWNGSEHYVADRVMEELPQLIGESREDIIVETTVDLHLQKLAERSIRKLVAEEGERLRVSQGALVSIDGSGAVRSLVGGYDYANSQFDRASEGRRQPGSAFKPFVFLAALEQGRTPASRRNDAPIRIGKWTPENYGGKYRGEVTLSEAMALSLNSVAAQLTQEVGPETVAETAQRLGIRSDLRPNASLALGTSEVTLFELVSAYVPFANGGQRPPIHIVRRITKASGELLYEHHAGAVPRVIRPEHVAMMNTMMTGTLEYGTARNAAFGWPAAGKTGTSQNARDAWFVGYTSNLVTGVWFGNDDGKPTRDVTGGSLPARAWKTFMAAAHEGLRPSGLHGGLWAAPVPELPLQASPAILAGEGAMPARGPEAHSPAPPVPPAGIGESRRAGSGVSLLDRLFGLY